MTTRSALYESTETPPRAWGRQPPAAQKVSRNGNTPTSVGKTWSRQDASISPRKHPHERGEDLSSGLICLSVPRNTPTSVGKTLFHADHPLIDVGNTPTSVGKTLSMAARVRRKLETPPRAWGRPVWYNGLLEANEKHPHERGEDGTQNSATNLTQETPPRAWGRPVFRHPKR